MAEITENKQENNILANPETAGETLVDERPKIETYTVQNELGEPVTVADSRAGDQLEVSLFAEADIIRIKRTVVLEKEREALDELAGKSLEQKGTIARQAIEQSADEYRDLPTLQKLFAEYRDRLLEVKSSTVRDDRIPKEGRHFLIAKNDAQELTSDLRELGYEIHDLEDQGIRARRGETKLNFIYSKEKNKEEAQAPTSEIVEIVYATKSLLNELGRAGAPPESLASLSEQVLRLEKALQNENANGQNLRDAWGEIIMDLEALGKLPGFKESGLIFKWSDLSRKAAKLAHETTFLAQAA